MLLCIVLKAWIGRVAKVKAFCMTAFLAWRKCVSLRSSVCNRAFVAKNMYGMCTML